MRLSLSSQAASRLNDMLTSVGLGCYEEDNIVMAAGGRQALHRTLPYFVATSFAPLLARDFKSSAAEQHMWFQSCVQLHWHKWHFFLGCNQCVLHNESQGLTAASRACLESCRLRPNCVMCFARMPLGCFRSTWPVTSEWRCQLLSFISVEVCRS